MCLIIIPDIGYSQSSDKKEKRNAFYPLNIPYAFFGRYQSSVEFGIGKADYLFFSGHFNTKLNYQEGKGGGFDIQYRVNRNRDPNVEFGSITYWGPYLEYDKINVDYYSPYQQPSFEEIISMVNFGVLIGYKFNLGRYGIFDLYYGFGVINVKVQNSYNEYGSTYPYFKAGLQFGIRF